MAATARRRDPDDDIAAIAKQISDHAEAIYQTWKSRGLAPADLLTCHAGDTARLDSMLTPGQPAVSVASSRPSIELLAQAPTMDNNRLEKLVNNFVVEDKARIAASRNTNSNKPMPSSIQYALQKFERNAGNPVLTKKAPMSPPSTNNTSSPSSTAPMQVITMNKPAISQKPQLSPKPRLSETVEITLPADHIPNNKMQNNRPSAAATDATATTPTAAANNLANNSNSMQTWPLKNRVISTDAVKKAQPTSTASCVATPNNNRASSTATAYLDEVALEEKRLINALKNGVILNEESTSTVVRTKEEKEPTRWGLRRRTEPAAPSSTSAGGGIAVAAQQSVPHPELTTTQRQHLRAASGVNPVRPFLTRGSVAERVLIFERCPSDLLLDKRARAPVLPLAAKPQLPVKQVGAHTTLQRHVRTHRNVHIPRFYFPSGKPGPPGQVEQVRARVAAVFAKLGERVARDHFPEVTAAAQLPVYWKTPLFLAVAAPAGDAKAVTFDQFMHFWTQMAACCHDPASRFMYILSRGRRQWLCPEDLIPLVQDVVETHPGLTFLKEATEFHSRYVHTVIARIFYCANRSWSGRISIPELRRSDLLAVLQLLEEEEDINQVTAYFSYEHFYVIYCKFWELDRDHDLFIDKEDLTRHNDHALSTRIIDRIFSGCVTRGTKRGPQQPPQEEPRMSYTEFVWFLLSEEDKLHPTAVEYWFRCMDLDGDGFLSMYELEYFYEEQMHRMEAIGIETLPFQDCLCQMLDMVKPAVTGKIALSDLKKCRMTAIFYDTFFNLEKYLDHEQRDPFATQRDHDSDGQELSDWDRFAAEEYELLVAEEGGQDQQDSLSFDENNEDDLLSHNLDVVLDVEAPSDDSDECSI